MNFKSITIEYHYLDVPAPFCYTKTLTIKATDKALQADYYIDKVLNTTSMNYDKKWTELESFRDKYLVVRLIFDNFAQNRKHEEGSVKMIMNFSGENESHSFR